MRSGYPELRMTMNYELVALAEAETTLRLKHTGLFRRLRCDVSRCAEQHPPPHFIEANIRVGFRSKERQR